MKVRWAAGLFLAFLAVFLSLDFGPIPIMPQYVIRSLLYAARLSSKPPELYWEIIYYLRLPRVILALVVGAALALGGTSVQAIFRNPMAEPYVIGISSGAALGASLAIAFPFLEAYEYGLQLMAFLFSLLSVLLVYGLARSVSYSSSVGTPAGVLLLSGVAVSLLFGALSSFLLYTKASQRPEVIFWLLGSLSGANWQELPLVTGIVLACSLALFLFRRELDALSLGEEEAHYVGVNVRTAKWFVLSVTALMVASAVSVSGLIGFVGLMIPHMARMTFGSAHKVLLPASALMGAIFLLLCDDVARTAMAPLEIPIGIITALIGVPFFFLLMKGSLKR
ncbi:MAG: iron ABC transporter permease [TACK group archaeon]|nr:iron ABC transporter permease [TACK group archaeon]